MSEFICEAIRTRLQSAVDEINGSGFTVVMVDGKVKIIRDDAPVKALPAPAGASIRRTEQTGGCIESGCGEKTIARGLCGWHYVESAVVPVSQSAEAKPPAIDLESLMSAEEIDNIFSWQMGTAKKMAKRGVLPHFVAPDGKTIRFLRQDIEALMIRREARPGALEEYKK